MLQHTIGTALDTALQCLLQGLCATTEGGIKAPVAGQVVLGHTTAAGEGSARQQGFEEKDL
eukprot:scaffold89075_cov19-Tisochrysis_lutea.AAC.4